MILAIFEGLILSFILLLICVNSIKNGPVGGVHYYEQDVKERVVELGLITHGEIKRNAAKSGSVFMFFMLILSPLAVFLINGAKGFGEGFLQLVVIYMICGAFDRVFIDWYWVGHTKAWLIPGTEDLMPYIPKSAWVKKIVGTIIGYPVFAALISWVFSLIIL